MGNWTKAQWEAFGRHILTAAASAFAALVMTGALTSSQAAEYLGHITAFVTSIVALAATLGPLYAAIQAARSASPERQAKQTVKNLNEGLPLNGEKKKLIEAVAEQPEVRKVVMKDPVEADVIPSDKVTSA